MPTIIDSLVTRLGFETDLSALRRFDSAVSRTRRRLDSLSSQLFGVGRTVGIIGGAATGVFALAGKQAIQWETDFTGVRKTVNATEEEFAVLEETLRRMAREDVPLSAGELAGLAEQAGQLGIETDKIDQFVKTIAQLGTTTNLAADEGATQLARFANITQMSQDDFDRMGSTVVDLGNNFATTEAEIVHMALRLAGAGDLIGLTEAQILGISTALTSVGINAEAGGTAFSRVFTEMDKAVQEGGETLEIFGRLAGSTGGEFAGVFKEQGADAAILAFIAGLQRTIDSGENVHTVLEDLGFDNVRIRDSLLRSAGAGDLLTESIATGTRAWDENIALTREAELRYGTMASRLQFAKNRFNDLAITVGGILAPIVTDLVDRLEPLIEYVAEWVEKHPGAVKWFAGLAVALVAIGGALLTIGAALKGASILLSLVQGIVAIGSVIAGVGLGPLLIIIGALSAAALLIIEYWGEIKAFFAGFWKGFLDETDGIKNAFANVKDEITRVIDKLGLFKDEARDAEEASEDAGYSIGKFFGQTLAVSIDAIAVLIRGVTDLALGLWAVLKFIGVPEALALIWDALLVVKNGIEAVITGVWWLVDAFVMAESAIMRALDNVWYAIVDFFTIDLFAQGQAMLRSFIDGFLAVKDELIDAVSGVLDEVNEFLPFSDARRGPLASLTASGKAIVDTLVAGIRQAGAQPVHRALQVELAGVPTIDVAVPTLPSLTAPVLPSLSLPSLDDLSGMLNGFLSRLTAPALPSLSLPTLPTLELPNLDDLSGMLGGFLDRLPDLDTMTALPVGPVPQPALAGAGAGGEGITLTLSIGELNVTATNADPQEIAKAIVGGELARQVSCVG